MTDDPDRKRREEVSETLLGRVDHHIIVAMEMEASAHVTERIELEESLQITKGLLESARTGIEIWEKDDVGGFSRGWDAGKDEVRKKCIEYLLIVGKELAENGEGLSRFEPVEGAIRKRAGWLFHDVAQILFTDQRSDEFDKGFNVLKEKIEEAIGMSIDDAIAEVKELEKDDDE